MRTLTAVLIAAAVAVGCSSKSKAPPEEDAGVRRRVFRPPPGGVRAVPPHNIHPQGIGPYRLGADLKDILNLLPHGPRVELFRLGKLADYSLVRTEGGGLIIGVERGTGVTFVATVEGEIARTEGDNGVGAPVDAVIEELGAEAASPRAVRDPSLLRPAALPEALFLTDGGRVVAVVVDRRERRHREEGVDGGVPPTCGPVADLESEILGAARLGAETAVRLSCRSGEPREAVVSSGDRLVWLEVGAGGPRPAVKRLAATAIEGLRYAAPLVLGAGEARGVLAVIEERTPARLLVRLDVLRLEGTRLVTVDSHELYELTADAVRLVGGSLSHAAIATEIEVEGGELVGRGLFIQNAGPQLTLVAPLEPLRLELDLRRRSQGPREPGAESQKAPPADGGHGIGAP